MIFQYADLDNLVKDLSPLSVGNADETAAIGRVLNGVSNFIDKFTRRPEGYFLPAGDEPFAARFRGSNQRFLKLPPYVGAATITGIASELYYAHNPSGWLYAVPLVDSSYSGEIPSYFASRIFSDNYLFEVVARWGFAETPAAIQEAARELTFRLWQTQRGLFGQLTPGGTVIEKAMPPFVEEVLLGFRRREFEVSTPTRPILPTPVKLKTNKTAYGANENLTVAWFADTSRSPASDRIEIFMDGDAGNPLDFHPLSNSGLAGSVSFPGGVPNLPGQKFRVRFVNGIDDSVIFTSDAIPISA